MIDSIHMNVHFLADEADHPDSTLVLAKLENIDSETDNLDITFVKMSDPKYARKWGVTKLPAIVYFRKRFPSIYRGEPDTFQPFVYPCDLTAAVNFP